MDRPNSDANTIVGSHARMAPVALIPYSHEPCPCCQKNTMKPKADPRDITFNTTALSGSTRERNDRIRMNIVIRLTTISSKGKLPYTAWVKDMSPAVAPPTSAPPRMDDNVPRSVVTTALPSVELPSMVGIM